MNRRTTLDDFSTVVELSSSVSISSTERNLGDKENNCNDVKPRQGSNYSDNNTQESKVRKPNNLFIFTVFLFTGTAGLIAWNSLLNMLQSLIKVVYEGQGSFTDTMTATYFTFLSLVTLFFSRIDSARPWILITSLAMVGALCIILALICTYVPPSAASAVLHVFGAVLGLTAGTVVCSALGTAAALPRMFVAAAASGMGLAGLITFTIWMISKYAIFPGDRTGVISAIWTLLGCSSFVCFLALALFVVFIKSNEAKQHHENPKLLSPAETATSLSQKNPKDEEPLEAAIQAEVVELKTYERLGFFGLVREVSGNIILRFFIFFQTMVVFPTIGPIGWDDPPLINDVSMGAFQLLDFAGRYLTSVFSALVFKESYLKWCLLVRCLLVISFILSMKFNSTPVFGDVWFHILQMGLLAFSNGWFSTVAIVHLPGHVDGAAAKSRVCALGVAVSIVGIVSAQWIAKGIKVLLRPK